VGQEKFTHPEKARTVRKGECVMCGMGTAQVCL
jgi:hypothetical protein